MTTTQFSSAFAAHQTARRLNRLLSITPETEQQTHVTLMKELFAAFGDRSYIKPPFRCDFGCNIRIGERFFSNYGCVFQDYYPITIGDHVMLGPKVLISATEKPVRIDSHVWLGGNTVVCSGVTIGKNVVIGAGSVVTGDIPDNVLAAGNPCRVTRTITEEDKRYWEAQLEMYRTCCDNPIV